LRGKLTVIPLPLVLVLVVRRRPAGFLLFHKLRVPKKLKCFLDDLEPTPWLVGLKSVLLIEFLLSELMRGFRNAGLKLLVLSTLRFPVVASGECPRMTGAMGDRNVCIAGFTVGIFGGRMDDRNTVENLNTVTLRIASH
jgi:hypothetical protein